MTAKPNWDGTIDVRVVLTVRIDPKAWVEDVMEEHAEEVLAKEVRRDVKARVRDTVLEHSETLGLRSVKAEGVYP